MKLTNSKLKQLIKEELQSVLNETSAEFGEWCNQNRQYCGPEAIVKYIQMWAKKYPEGNWHMAQSVSTHDGRQIRQFIITIDEGEGNDPDFWNQLSGNQYKP
jgi:hypothetical protein